MEKSNAATIPDRRPWYRLHLSTWLTLPLGLVVAMLVVLPGGTGQYPEQRSWNSAYERRRPVIPFPGHSWIVRADNNAVIHGWPLPFLWRTPRGWTGYPTPEDRYLPWELTDSVREFRVLPLIADFALAVVGALLFIAFVERRRRRRLRAFQFTLRELLVLAPIVAIALGWWNQNRTTDREVRERLSRLGASLEFGFVPRLPLWLRTLAGDDVLSRFGIDRPDGLIILQWDSSRQSEIRYVVEKFPGETLLAVGRDTSNDEVRSIAAIERLERIDCICSSPEKLTPLLAGLEHHSHLCSLTLMVGTGSLDAAQLMQISAIPRLDSLSILDASAFLRGDTDALTEKELDGVRNCKKLEELDLPRLRLTQGTVDCLGDLKKLRRLKLDGGQFIQAGLSPLCNLRALEQLAMRDTNFDDDDARQLRSLLTLRRLDITDTQVTTAGVKEMLDPSGGSAGRTVEQICLDADVIDGEVIAIFKKLPRLRRITVTESLRNSGWAGNANGSVDSQLILDLQKALPNCEIISMPVFWVNT